MECFWYIPYFILCKLVCHSHQLPLRAGEKSSGAPGNIFLATPPQNNKASPPLLSPLHSSGRPISLIGIHPMWNSSYQYSMINSLVRPCASSKSWLLSPPFKREAWLCYSCFKEVQMDGSVFLPSEWVVGARDLGDKIHQNPSAVSLQHCYLLGTF